MSRPAAATGRETVDGFTTGKGMTMRFINLTDGTKTGSPELLEEYRNSHSYGVVVIGSDDLFVKKGLKVYYISYKDADRIFRRVRRVNAMMCCERSELEIEYLVVSALGKELIEVQLPGKKAARLIMEELKGSKLGVELSAPVAAQANG